MDGASLGWMCVREIGAKARSLGERGQPGAFDGRNVHEGVVAAALGLDEAVALVEIEEFQGADRHSLFLSRIMARPKWPCHACEASREGKEAVKTRVRRRATVLSLCGRWSTIKQVVPVGRRKIGRG